MRVVEGRDAKRFDITDYMNNFNRESQTGARNIDNNIADKNKLTLADLQALRRKPKDFIKNTEDDY